MFLQEIRALHTKTKIFWYYSGTRIDHKNFYLFYTLQSVLHCTPNNHRSVYTQMHFAPIIRTPNPTATQYYAEHVSTDSDSDSHPFPIVSAYYRNLCPSPSPNPNPSPNPAMEISHDLGLRFGSLSQMGGVAILGMYLYPKDRSLSLLHTFQSGDQSLNLNLWKILV